MDANDMGDALERILISEQQIADKLQEMATQIDRDRLNFGLAHPQPFFAGRGLGRNCCPAAQTGGGESCS